MAGTREIPEWERAFMEQHADAWIVKARVQPVQVPVNMTVGEDPTVVIGWIEHPSALPGLLRSVADEMEKIKSERESDGPGADR